jgi:hypothetical protein
MAVRKTTDKSTFQFTVEPLELKQLFRLLNAMPKDVQNGIRDKAQAMSRRLAGQLMMYAHASPTPQAALVAESILTPRDRLIRVDIGGTKKVGRKYGGTKSKRGTRTGQTAAAAGTLMWGSEGGSHPGVDRIGRKYTNRFGAGKNDGYWIKPAVDWYTPKVADEYIVMVKAIIRENGLD